MSSTGVNAINSGPLAIRTYNNGSNKTFILKDYDYPVSSNFVLITSTNGLLAPSDNIYISSIAVSSLVADYATVSTSHLSTIYSIDSTITFNNQVNINSNPTGGLTLFVNGSTVFSEPGAQTSAKNGNVTIWGLPGGDPISEIFSNTQVYTINSTISKINFQLIGAGGNSTFANTLAPVDAPGYGGYIQGTLNVKQGDKLAFWIGQPGTNVIGSGGTSMVYYSSIGTGQFISTLVCVAGAGGGNGFAMTNISSSSGGGHGGGGNGIVYTTGNIDYIATGSNGFDGISTNISGAFISDTDGGAGGQTALGGAGGNGNPPSSGRNGNNGASKNITNLTGNGGVVTGGQGGVGTKNGGWGGGGYTGGGGGGAGTNTSAGGGGGATYIATSTLSGYLSNLVCLSGEFISQNNAIPFGSGQGLPLNPGLAAISGYSPNDTLYTNGDIECRVLKYEMLDPPINAIGGSAALWALHPAIDTVNMNENRIIESGSIEVVSGGVDVTGSSRFQGSTFYFSSVSAKNSDTFKIELTNANFLVYKSTVGANDTTFIQNNAGGQLVVATDKPVIFTNSQTIQGNNNVGILTSTPQVALDVNGQIRAAQGSAANPAFLFTSDSNTGLYGIGDGQMGMSANGSERIKLNNLSIDLTPASESFVNVYGSENVASTLTASTINVNTLSSNVILANNTITTYLSTNFISSGNVVNTISSATNSIQLNSNIGNVVISAAPYIDIIPFNNVIPINYGKYAVITDTNVNSISLTSALNPPNGSFINLINQSGITYNVLTDGVSQTLFNNTLMTTIFYSPLNSWFAPSYYTLQPLYIYVNDFSTEIRAQTGYLASELGPFSYLDYAIIGGGGGGGSSERTGSGAHYGGGGGGSGFLVASFTFNGTNDVFLYEIPTTAPTGTTSPDATNTKISLANYKKISVTIGGGGARADTPDSGADVGNTGYTGGTTTITVTYNDNTTVTRSVYGGLGGNPGNDNASSAGQGGTGWNGGGSGSGGNSNVSGGVAIGGVTGESGTPSRAGEGGGLIFNGINQGGDNNSNLTDLTSENAGGGGAGGTSVKVTITGNRTGGQGAASYRNISNQSSGAGLNYTGAAGGGGSNNVGGGVMDASPGGKGYAILWLHN